MSFIKSVTSYKATHNTNETDNSLQERPKQKNRHMKLCNLFYGMMLTCCIEAQAQDRAIEMRADRTVIYPQRIALQGDETLGDILSMYPDLMQNGFDNMLSDYNLRIDNVPVNSDYRITCQQLKTRMISSIQICDNTGVAKGTTGLNRVIDIKLVKDNDGLSGRTGIEAGTDNLADHHALVRYDHKSTDLIALSSFSYQDIDNTISQKQHLFAHMTNQLSPKDNLLTYFTQQYTNTRMYLTDARTKAQNEKCLARARYFHTFNDKGTELLLVGSYQYANSPYTMRLSDTETTDGPENSTGMYIVELNTPLYKGLTMMAGAEGDFTYSNYKTNTVPKPTYMNSNNDLYLQFNYLTGTWRFTLGDRLMFFHYSSSGMKHDVTRTNIEASAVKSIASHSQVQAAYHRKFFSMPFVVNENITPYNWAQIKSKLQTDYIDEAKLAYTYTRRRFNASLAAYYQMMEHEENVCRLYASAYYRAGIMSMTAGANLYFTEGHGNDMATFHLTPRISLPCQMKICAQSIFATGDRQLPRDEDVYLAAQLSKQFGAHWNTAIEWHDICSRHYSACMATLQYVF